MDQVSGGKHKNSNGAFRILIFSHFRIRILGPLTHLFYLFWFSSTYQDSASHLIAKNCLATDYSTQWLAETRVPNS